MAHHLPRLYTEQEAAEYLGVSARTVARLRTAGKIGSIEVADRRHRYLEEHLLAYLGRQARGPAIDVQAVRAARAKRKPPASSPSSAVVPKEGETRELQGRALYKAMRRRLVQ